eukprot:6455753-Amphidinium_carterae.1
MLIIAAGHDGGGGIRPDDEAARAGLAIMTHELVPLDAEEEEAQVEEQEEEEQEVAETKEVHDQVCEE